MAARVGTDRRRLGRRRGSLAPAVSFALLVASVVLTYAAVTGPDDGEPVGHGSEPAAGPELTVAAAPTLRHRAEEHATPRPTPAPPVRLRIDRLQVDVPVEAIRSSAGVLEPPSDPQRVGWWSGGAMPGALRGRALLTGHTVHTGGGVFDDLDLLRAGDALSIRTVDGPLRYRVVRTRFLTTDQLAARARSLFRSDGPMRLALVTCEGWDGAGYDGNTVVTAAPIA